MCRRWPARPAPSSAAWPRASCATYRAATDSIPPLGSTNQGARGATAAPALAGASASCLRSGCCGRVQQRAGMCPLGMRHGGAAAAGRGAWHAPIASAGLAPPCLLGAAKRCCAVLRIKCNPHRNKADVIPTVSMSTTCSDGPRGQLYPVIEHTTIQWLAKTNKHSEETVYRSDKKGHRGLLDSFPTASTQGNCDHSCCSGSTSTFSALFHATPSPELAR